MELVYLKDRMWCIYIHHRVWICYPNVVRRYGRGMSATCPLRAEMSHMWPCQEMRTHVVLPLTICLAEGDKRKWHKVCDLYEPADTLRSLGLKVLDWPGTYRPGSKEDGFLRRL